MSMVPMRISSTVVWSEPSTELWLMLILISPLERLSSSLAMNSIPVIQGCLGETTVAARSL